MSAEHSPLVCPQCGSVRVRESFTIGASVTWVNGHGHQTRQVWFSCAECGAGFSAPVETPCYLCLAAPPDPTVPAA